MPLAASENTCNHFKTNHLENNPPSRKLMTANKRKLLSDICGKKRIVKILEKTATGVKNKGWHQQTQLSSILYQNGQKSNGFQCERCCVQTGRQVWDEPQKREPLLPDPPERHCTTKARVNLDIQNTPFFHHLKPSESLWNARACSAYKESFILQKIAILFFKFYR